LRYVLKGLGPRRLPPLDPAGKSGDAMLLTSKNCQEKTH
jgi:hypothetical protein